MFRVVCSLVACFCVMLAIPSSSCLDEPTKAPDSIGDPVAVFLRDLYRGVVGEAPVEHVVEDLRPRYETLTGSLGEAVVYDDLTRLFTIRREELHAVLAYQDRLWDALQLLG